MSNKITPAGGPAKRKKRHGKPFTCATCGRGYSVMAPIMACDKCWKAELARLGISTSKRRKTLTPPGEAK